MKPVRLIPAIIAIAIAGVLVGAQKKSISRLEQETEILRQHIARAKTGTESATDGSRPPRPKLAAGKDGPIDWEKIAESIGEMERAGGVTDMREMLSFQRRLHKMEKEELIAALKHIAALDLDEMQRFALEEMILRPLILKDPELALLHFASRISDGRHGMSYQLGNALSAWAKKDPTAAMAWFDKEIAAGTFDSKSLDGQSAARTNFEGGLITQLLSSDPAAAETRIASLPEDQITAVLSLMRYQKMGSMEQAAFVELARKHLSKANALEVIAGRAANLATLGDMGKVEEYIDNVSLSPEERTRCTEEAARNSVRMGNFSVTVSTGKIDSMRQWLGERSPDSVERITGEAIGNLMSSGEMKFPEASGLVLKYHEESGSDDLLSAFLENAQFWGKNQEVQGMAEKISDPAMRQLVLDKINFDPQ